MGEGTFGRRRDRESGPHDASRKLLYRTEQSGAASAIKNPVVGVSMFREPLDSMRVINFDEQAAYLAKTSQPLHDIAKIILDTGMRPRRSFQNARRESRSETEGDS